MSENETKGKLEISFKAPVLDNISEVIKDFLMKVVGPTATELGMAMQNQIALYRFKQSIRTLEKAREYCIKKGINPRVIPIKQLAPILEKSSLEDDEFFEDKWAILLGNMVDADQNIENHVLPMILSELSKQEYIALENAYNRRLEILLANKKAADYLKEKNKNGTISYEEKLKELTVTERELAEKGITHFKDPELYSILKERHEIKSKLMEMESPILKYNSADTRLSEVSNEFMNMDISNLIRLGLLKEIYHSGEKPQNLEFPDDLELYEGISSLGYIRLSNEKPYSIYMTQLATLLIKACQEKRSINPSV